MNESCIKKKKKCSTGHAKDALELARMQEQTVQLEHQSKVKVGVGGGGFIVKVM